MLDGTEFFECMCGSDEHTLRFTLNFDVNDYSGDYPCIYTSIFLREKVWWERIWVAVKYVFGYKCIYGHWDNWEMLPKDVHRLKAMCEKFISETQGQQLS